MCIFLVENLMELKKRQGNEKISIQKADQSYMGNITKETKSVGLVWLNSKKKERKIINEGRVKKQRLRSCQLAVSSSTF